MLEAQNITGSRSEQLLFWDLNFQALPREIIYVRGPNGAGKTTLLRMLCGLVRPDSGTIFWDGVPIADCESEYHRALAYIGHDNGIKGDLTALENLQFFHRIYCAPSRPSPTQALERLDTSNLAHIPCRYLSAGQKRRVAMARLLILNARLWLLDEPFSGLDESARRIVSDLVAEHLGSDGLCIATSHQPLDYEQFGAKEINLGMAS